jgi:NitT/TauT family transport system permease protein
MSRLSDRALRSILPPLAVFLCFAALWQAAVTLFDIKPFLLPSPLMVFQAMVGNATSLLSAAFLTASAALSGFFLSLLVGLVIAFAFSQSRFIQRGCYPYAIFLQTVPIVAIAPLIIIWFGSGFRSVVLVSFIVSLFPIIANGTTGLVSVSRSLVELFDINNATRWQVLWKLRLPNAVPYLVTGAKTSSGLSVIGAIVGEFFAGYGMEKYGLGYLIYLTQGQLKTDYLFAAVIACTVLGLLIFGTSSLAGRLILSRWHESEQEGTP